MTKSAMRAIQRSDGGHAMKRFLTGAMTRSAIVAMLCSLSWSAYAVADNTAKHPINIPPQNLASALQELSKQSDTDLVFRPEQVKGLHTHGLVGTFSAEQAVTRLIAGTRLKVSLDASGALLIAAPLLPAAPAREDPGAVQLSRPLVSPTRNSLHLDQTTSGETPRASYTSASVAAAAGLKSAAQQPQGPALEEVIVTAQKREQRLVDVPVPVTAISASTLIENHEVRLQDYFATVPGLNFSTDQNGGAILSIRGLNTGFANPTTSITIDGVPFGSSSGYGGFVAPLPDIDPSDLARVEVLRGPQGTLYGSSSLGGLINYVTEEPSLQQLSGRMEADLSGIQNAQDPAYAVRAAANVPISDSVAVRISGFGRRTPGYIDNVLTGQKGTNRVDTEGAYVSLLIRATDRSSLRLSALYQNNEGYGLDYADPSLGDLKQDNVAGTGVFHSSIQAYSAVFKAGIGAARFTSLTGYNVNSIHDVLDDTYFFGSVAQALYGVQSAVEPDRQRTAKLTQELRLALPLSERIDWLLGLFYTHESASANQQWWAADMTTGAVVPGGNLLDGTWPTTYSDYSAFTNLTVRLTDRLDVQFGGRESQNRQTYSEADGGGYTTVFGLPEAPAPLISPEVVTKDNSFTYLVTPRYRISHDVIAYVRLATGYRPGGPNPTCSAFALPCHFDPDKTQDYEIGMKGDVLDHRLGFDASVFYIDWKHIQIQTTAACGCANLYVNAGSAKSQGVELAVQGRPALGLTLSGWVDFTDAVLTAGFPPDSATVGGSGDRLPFSSRYSANFSAEQDFSISPEATLFAGGQMSYVGNRLGYFESAPQRSYYPAYAETSLRGGILLGNWRVTAFATNVTNRRGILGGSLPVPYYGHGYSYIQPRTIGLSVADTF